MPETAAEVSTSSEWDQIMAAQVNPQAFAPLYEANADLIWRFTLARLGDPEDAGHKGTVPSPRR